MQDVNPELDYAVINVWTDKHDQAIPGQNIGHVSIQTKYQYISLWPQPREEKVASSSLSFVERSKRDIYSFFETRPRQFKNTYLEDCVAEAFHEDQVYEIGTMADLKQNEVALLVKEDGVAEVCNDKYFRLKHGQSLYAVQPIQAQIRLALFSVKTGLVHKTFEEFRRSTNGWRLIGSNGLIRHLNVESSESCVSLAYRLLKSGGIAVDLEDVVRSSQTESVVTMHCFMKYLIAAKEQEINVRPESLHWEVPGATLTNFSEVKRRYQEQELQQKQDSGCTIL